MARTADDERLVPSPAFDHEHADARAAVVMEAGVTRFPPRVEPGLRVVAAPQELEGPLAVSLECRDVDRVCRRACCRGAFLGREVSVGHGERLESCAIEHALILDHPSGT